MSRLTIALDAMGGDFGPSITIPAALKVLVLYPQLELIIVGDPTVIDPLLVETQSIFRERLTIIPVKSFITNDIKPSQAIRTSRGTSMRVALELIQTGRAQACVSAGNTGALMGLSKLLLKPINGIDRPALMVVLPNQKQGKTVVLDLGANVTCNGEMLTQFAMMGSSISEHIVGVVNPRVALLNIGEEDVKGPESIHRAASLLQNIPSVNYIGYLEANELLFGKTDVLVCDGFAGNVTLKTLEGAIKAFMTLLKYSRQKRVHQRWLVSCIKRLMMRSLTSQFGSINPDQYNGAWLVGLHGIVIKSHSAANQYAFAAAIEQAIKAVEHHILRWMAECMKTLPFQGHQVS